MPPASDLSPSRPDLDWNRFAPHYLQGLGEITECLGIDAVSSLGLSAGESLLDVGCGSGGVVHAASTWGVQAIGLDASIEMIRAAEAKHPGRSFVHASAYALPYADESFDGVSMNFVYVQLREPARALLELIRVLKRGGRAIFSCWDSPASAVPFGLARQAVRTFNPTAEYSASYPTFFASENPIFDALHWAPCAGLRTSIIRFAREWQASSPAKVFDNLADGAARTRALLEMAGPSANLTDVRERFITLSQPYHAEATGLVTYPMTACAVQITKDNQPARDMLLEALKFAS